MSKNNEHYPGTQVDALKTEANLKPFIVGPGEPDHGK